MFAIIATLVVLITLFLMAKFTDEMAGVILVLLMVSCLLGIPLSILTGIEIGINSSVIEKEYLALQEISAQEVIYINEMDRYKDYISVPYGIDANKPVFLQFRYSLDETKSIVFWRNNIPKFVAIYNVVP